MSSQVVNFDNPSSITGLQGSVYDSNANFSVVNTRTINNAVVSVPFTYANLFTDLQALEAIAWSTTNSNFYQTMSTNGVIVQTRAEWLANQFMSGAATLGLSSKYSGWSFRFTMARSDGTCLYDSLAANAAPRVRITTLGGYAGTDIPTLKLATGCSANLSAGAPYSATAAALSTLVTVNNGLGIFATTGSNVSAPSLGGSIYLDGVKGTVFTENQNCNKEFAQGFACGTSYGLRTDTVSGNTKYTYFVVASLPLESPSTPNTGSTWAIRVGYIQN